MIALENLEQADDEFLEEINQFKQFFRKRITELRLEKGVNEVQMSLELGKSRNYIFHISSGQAFPSMTQFFNICLYLEITPEQFFDPNFRSPSLLKKSLKLMEKMTNKELENLNVIMESMVGNR
ncbi:helix-turn-helix transcriptional regulator [Solibaculum mannosilyticum]|uniref:helix-turn-helix transcriptional regulator n=1 Tax=Solibaculum mannosilyticum TaxID=2780922 RepID=UPI0007A8DEC1|nr:Helix-turn-helix domain protein [Eubacteriaceae bacterium CHKCI005]